MSIDRTQQCKNSNNKLLYIGKTYIKSNFITNSIHTLSANNNYVKINDNINNINDNMSIMLL